MSYLILFCHFLILSLIYLALHRKDTNFKLNLRRNFSVFIMFFTAGVFVCRSMNGEIYISYLDVISEKLMFVLLMFYCSIIGVLFWNICTDVVPINKKSNYNSDELNKIYESIKTCRSLAIVCILIYDILFILCHLIASLISLIVK